MLSKMGRSTLHSILSTGGFANVTFRKRTTGEVRVMNCRLGVTKHLKGGVKAFDDQEKNLITVYDMEKKGYRSINCDDIIEVKANGHVYV